MWATSFGLQSDGICCLRAPTPDTSYPILPPRLGAFSLKKCSIREPYCALRVSMVMLLIK